MSEIFYSEEYKGHKIEIFYDQDADSPKEWGDNSVFLVGFHRQFWVEDERMTEGLVSSIFAGGKYEDDSVNEEARAVMKKFHVFPLEAYIHSGVSLALASEGGFPDRAWDVSTLGAVFVAKSEARTKKKARELALGLIKTWNIYLEGSVYGFSIDDGEGDSCWGFYEDDYRPEEMECLKQARESIDYMVEKERKAKQERTKALIKNRVPLLARG